MFWQTKRTQLKMLKSVIVVAILACLTMLGFHIWKMFDFHRTRVYNHYPGPCKTLPNIDHGSEDMAEIPGDKVLITSGFRFINRGRGPFKELTPKVMLFDFNEPDQGAQPVSIQGFRDLKECDFHGISAWVDKNSGEVVVFIVNHLAEESVVEIFIYNDNKMALLHQHTAGSGDPNFRFLNNVVGLGPRQFYVTNMMHTRNTLEHYLMLKWGSITYYDNGKSLKASLDTLHSPNGISLSPDGQYIYLAVSSAKEVRTYTMNSDHTLALKDTYHIDTSIDNFYVDQNTGDLWAACHYISNRMVDYIYDPAKLSPVQVLRLKMTDGRVSDVTEVLMDDGKVISGSSVAVYKRNKLLMGTVFTNTLLCDVKYV